MSDAADHATSVRTEAQQARQDAINNLRDALTVLERAEFREREAVVREAEIVAGERAALMANLPAVTMTGRSLESETVSVHFANGSHVVVKEFNRYLAQELIDQRKRQLAALIHLANERGYTYE